MLINENTIEQACLQHLQELGWDYTHGSTINADGENPWRLRTDEVVFRSVLREAVERLNPQLPSATVDEVVALVCKTDITGLTERNQQAYRYLREGVRVEYRENDEQKVEFARLIDFQQPSLNRFDVVNQLTILGRKGNRRPDVICYINGLPVVVLELKNPLKENADLPQAFNQLQTYKQEIGDLFVYNQALVISDGILAKAGSLTADLERFTPWRVVDEKNKQRISFEHELEGLVRGLLNPASLLDYIQNFIVFEQTSSGRLVKKIAAYHQFYGVNEAVDCTLWAASEQGNGKIGVMWHTQGSGKSLSMLFYAGKLLSQAELRNPTIVVVTDRNDLDGQLYATFSGGQALIRQQPVQADGREALREELAKRETGGVIFTTIQKFGLQEGEQAHPVLNERHNIIVISDEAHRSQYGFSQSMKLNEANRTGTYRVGYAKHLRDALPNASFIGFTGTPISLEDKDTQEVFGKYVSIYDITDAVEDGATVPIIYEARQIPIAQSAEFDNVVQEAQTLIDEDDESSYNFRLREKLMGTEGRLSRLAEDFVKHFEQRTALIDGKAMVVAMSRQICVKLYEKITALRPEWHSDDVNEGAIKIVMTGSASDPADIQKHIYSSQDKKLLERRFKDPDDPLKIVIVRDMWLTGFDAPCCNTMYIDKPMKGHNLMQAIARVNRVFRNKSRDNGGLIVDYVGLTSELREATEQYTRSHGKGQMTHNIAEIKAKMLEYIDVVRGQFATPVNDQPFKLFDALKIEDELALFKQVMLGANHILALDHQTVADKTEKTPRRNAFLKAVRLAKKGFSLCGADGDVQQYQKELAFYDAVRAILAKREPNSTASSEERQLQLVALLNKAVDASGAINLFDLLNREQPNINILSEEFLEKIKNSQTKELWLLAVERYLRSQINEKGTGNLAVQKDFSERLKEALNKYHNQNLTIMQVLEELLNMSKEFAERLQRGEKLGLSPAEIAFYDALARNESAVRELGDDALKNLAKAITDKLRKSATIDWQYKEAVRAKMRNLVRVTLRLFKYPPDKCDEAIQFVLEQAEVIADELTTV
ncbi:type I restriction endonuclease subunit R [Glaesserella parasuis]|nr:type I restriction endonuclease subunit R [Glaesserella parasuis]MCT8721284.1 type I restriction endonuclease subunit R [Glaesserella parasuis]MCT8727639.1 type I restriction endonuclease subunit R [Glaesserella parasuis]MDE3993248.1 type I restriction endonuclease subunit R [Glaesserella parasuis]